MANNSPGGYRLENGEEDGIVRTAPCLDTKGLDEGRHEEDDPTVMSERLEPFPYDFSCVDLENKCGLKPLETSEQKEEVGADEQSHAKSDSLSSRIAPITSNNGKTQPREEFYHLLKKPDNHFKNSVPDQGTQQFGNLDTQLTQKDMPDPKHYSEYSPGVIPEELKPPAEETNTNRHQTKAAELSTSKRLQEEEKPSVPCKRKADKYLNTGSWSFKDGKEFPNREPQCLRGDSATHLQGLNKDKAPSTGNRSCSEINKGSPIFGYEESPRATEKKYLCFEKNVRMITDNKTLKEEIACTASRADTEFREGFYAKRHRTSKTLIECSNEGSASNIVTHDGHDILQSFAARTQIKQEGEDELCGSRLFITERENEEDNLFRHQNDEEEKYMLLKQSNKKPSTKSASSRTTRTRQETDSCVHQLGKEDVSFQSDEIAPQHTDHDKTLEQGQRATREPIVPWNQGSISEIDSETGYKEYTRKSEKEAHVLKVPDENHTYANDRNGEGSCKKNGGTFYIRQTGQTLARILNQDQLNAHEEDSASNDNTTEDIGNASIVPDVACLASTDWDDRTFSAPPTSANIPESKDFSYKTVSCRDTLPIDHPGFLNADGLLASDTQGNDSTDSQKNPDDDIVGFTEYDDYTAAQTDANTLDMNAQSVLPNNPTPALNEKEDGGPAEHGHGFVSIEDVETPSYRRSSDSDISNMDQHQGDNEKTSETEHSAINNVVVSVGLTGSMSELNLETSYNHDESEHVSDGHQERKHQDNPAGFVLDAEVKEKSAEVLTAESDKPECDKHYAIVHPRMFELGDNSSADFQEGNDKNRTHDMPASFGAVSVPSNTTAPASRVMDLNDRNFNNCSNNYLKSEDDLEDLSAVRHGLLTDPPSPSSRNSPFITDTSNGKATHRRTARQHHREIMPCSVRSHVTHERPGQSQIMQTQNNYLFESDGELQKVHNDYYTSQLSKGSECKVIKLYDCGDQQSSLAEKKEQRKNYQLPEDSSDVPFIVLEEERQYRKPGMVNWQDDGTENIRDYHFLWNISESGIGFSDHRFPFKQNMQGIDLHRNSNPVSQSSSREQSDLEMLARKANTKEHFLPEDLFSFDERRPSSITLFEEFLPWFKTLPYAVKGPRDKNAIDSILYPHLHLRSAFQTCIVACPVLGKNSPYSPNPALDDEVIEGPQDEDRGHLEDGARPSTPPQPRQPDRQGTAERECDPRRAVFSVDPVEPEARDEHQLPYLGIPSPSRRQTDRQGTAVGEGEPGGAVICVDRVERGPLGERRLPNRGIVYTAHPCCCLQCSPIHLRANIGLPALAVPFPTECCEDGGNYMNAGITPQVFVSTFLRHRGTAAERSSRPCDVSRLSQTGRRIWCPNFTCRGNWTQDSSACLDCQGVHVHQNENIRVEQQPCSHINSTTPSTAEEVDIAVHDGGRFYHSFVAPGHGLCVMCGRHAVNTRLHNCLHQVVCRHCARFVRVCPMCGEPVVCFFVF
ncbi:uncharacterized protein [Littorina saxatilis]|uniref:uncharacterized protein isoform X1 n=1 Tax=Littorina saxatilis TaxID=31220 RepID=UPI0038B581BA